MQLDLLDAKHDSYEAWCHIWKECNALYAGGAVFDTMMEHFLPQNPQEPPDVYRTRKQEAAYLSYVGPIVDYFVSWLFSAAFSVRPKNAETDEILPTPKEYTDFMSDVAGDMNLVDFIRKRTSRTLICGASHWLIELPELTDEQQYRISYKQMSKEEYELAGLGSPSLQAIDRDQVWDWETDAHGKLQWVVIHWIEQTRPDPRKGKRSTVRETWRIYDQKDCETFVLEYEEGKRPADPKIDVPSRGRVPHRFFEVPVVTLCVDDGLWIGERTRKAQIEHFRLSVAKNWLVRRTCYAMPVLQLENPENDTGIMGAGYYLKLGKDDKFSWTAPPNTPFDVLQASIDSQRDEIFRVVHQMAQGLDNNADTVGRSADSKQIDTAATRIILNAYGAVVRKAIEETLEILSDALGDEHIYWSVEGFTGYDTATIGELVGVATQMQALGIPSRTFRAEMKVKVANAALADLAQDRKEIIRQEIHAATERMPELEELELTPNEYAKIRVAEIKAKSAMDVTKKKADADLKMAKEAPPPAPVK